MNLSLPLPLTLSLFPFCCFVGGTSAIIQRAFCARREYRSRPPHARVRIDCPSRTAAFCGHAERCSRRRQMNSGHDHFFNFTPVASCRTASEEELNQLRKKMPGVSECRERFASDFPDNSDRFLHSSPFMYKASTHACESLAATNVACFSPRVDTRLSLSHALSFTCREIRSFNSARAHRLLPKIKLRKTDGKIHG